MFSRLGSDSEDLGETVIYTTEAHEGHGQEASDDEGDGHALHSLGDVHRSQLLTDGSEDGQCQAEAEGGADGIDDTGEEIGLDALGVVSALCHEDGNAEDGAVRGDEGQEDAEGLVEGRRHLLQNDLHHLHEGSDDEDEGDGLQVFEVVALQETLDEVSHDGSYREHEGHSGGHAEGSVHFLRHTEEGADSEELREHDIVDEDGREEY